MHHSDVRTLFSSYIETTHYGIFPSLTFRKWDLVQYIKMLI